MAAAGLGSSLVKTVVLKVVGDGGDANKTLDEIAAKAEALKQEHPELTVAIDRAKASADALVVKAEMRRVLADPIKVPVEADVDTNKARTTLSRIIGQLFGSKLGGWLGGTGGGAGSGIPYIGGALGAIGPAGGLAGLGILGGTGVLGVATALLSALAGLGAFGALAYPTVSGILSGNSSYAAAIGNYQTASANLSTAINQSAADQADYQATLANTEPDLRNAAALLTNQNVQWQNLTPSMQNSLTALRDNSAAYKILLPDQKNALNALLKQRDAWNGLTPVQQAAIGPLQKLAAGFDALVAKVEPLAGKVVDLGLSIGTKLLPVLGQFANAAGPAVVTLLKQLNTAAGSPAFKSFVDQMVRLVPGTLIAVGQGLGQIAGALSNVALASVKVNDQTKILTIALDILAGSLNTVAFLADASAAALKGIIGFLGWLLGGSGGAPLGAGLPSVGSINPALGNLGGLTPGGSYGTGSTYTPLPGFGPGQKTAPLDAAVRALSAAVTSGGGTAGYGGQVLTVRVQGEGPLTDAIAQSMRGYVHGHGGNVQAALGTG